jgi:hypothetical protein
MPRVEGVSLDYELMPKAAPAPAPAPTPPPEPSHEPPAPPVPEPAEPEVPPAKPEAPEPEEKQPKRKATEKPEKSTVGTDPSRVAENAQELILNRILGRKPKEAEAEGEAAEGEEPAEGDKKKPKKEKAKPAKEPKAPAKAPSLYEPEEESTEAPPEPRPANKPRIPRGEDIAKATAAAVGEVLRDRERPQPGEQPPSAPVPREWQELATEAEIAARLHPDRYEGRNLRGEVMGFVRERGDYEKGWKKEHPGEKFDWQDEDHQAWIDEHAVDVDSDHLDEAHQALTEARIAERVRTEMEKKYEPVIQESQRRAVMEKHGSEIQSALFSAAEQVVRGLRPDLAEDEDAFSEFIRDPETVKAELSKDPIDEEVGAATIGEAIRFLDAAGRFQFGAIGPNAPEAFELRDRLYAMESEIAGLPVEKRPVLPDGRTFLPQSDYANKRDKSDYYSVFDWPALKHLIPLRAKNLARRHKAEMEKRIEKVAKARGFSNGAHPKAGDGNQNGSGSRPESSRKPAGPSLAAASTTNKPGREDGSSMVRGLPRAVWEKIGGKFM